MHFNYSAMKSCPAICSSSLALITAKFNCHRVGETDTHSSFSSKIIFSAQQTQQKFTE